MAERRVFVVGSLNADHRVRVARIPAAGETVLGSTVTVGAGGKGANQAVAASRAGAATLIVGVVGEDGDGDLIRAALSGESVDTHHVHTVVGTPTGRALITVDDAGENTIVVSPGANGTLSSDDVSAGLAGIGNGDHLLLQLETPMPIVAHAARTARDAGATVVVNAAPVPSAVENLLDLADLLVVNEHELADIAQRMRGDDTRGGIEDDMAAVVAASGAGVVCTAGSVGAFVWSGDGVAHVPSPAVAAVDSTAAGDTFIGYLAAALTVDPEDLIGAIRYAVRAAAVAVTRAGAIDSIPHRNELETVTAATEESP